MPPSSGFEIITEHLVGLVSEINALRDEIKANEASKNKEIQNIKADVKTLLKTKQQNVQNLASGTSNASQQRNNVQSANNGVNQRQNQISLQSGNSSVNNRRVDSQAAGTLNLSKNAASKSNGKGLNAAAKEFISKNNRETSGPQSAENDEDTSVSNDDSGYTMVDRRNRKKKSFITGNKTSCGAFKGAAATRDFYVGRCDTGVQEKDVFDFVKNTIKVNIISCETLSKSGASVKAFKIKIHAEDSEKVVNDSVWPENIRVRKYYNSSVNKN